MFRRAKRKDVSNEQVESNIEDVKTASENKENENLQRYRKFYSKEKLWKKIQKISKKAGSTLVYAVLLLYYTLQKPEIPWKVKATIIGALGYFILPTDFIPDPILGVGYVDDLGAITTALIQIAMYVDEDVKQQAKDKLANWFGDNVDTGDIDNKLQ